jgi:hypothetical protein
MAHPEAPEDCANGSDDDCDGAIDAQDGDCEVGCTDADGDDYSPDGGECGPVDCNDDDPAVNPGAREICDDGRDNDCDGFIDGADSNCAVSDALTVHKVIAPSVVRLLPGVPEEHQVKVFVRNDGDRTVRVHALLTADPERGLTIEALGPNKERIKPGQLAKFVFAVTFTEGVLEGGQAVTVHFTAVALNHESERSSPASPDRDTLVELWYRGYGGDEAKGRQRPGGRAEGHGRSDDRTVRQLGRQR